MKDNWADKKFVEDWDKVTSQGNPTRPEQLDILTSVIAAGYESGSLILDIGCGSGQVEEIIFRKCPQAKIIGVDSSEPMLEIAQKRLAHNQNFQAINKDVSKLELLDLPDGQFKIVFTAQVLHELAPESRRELFKKVHQLLEAGGMFLVMDRIKVDLETFKTAYQTIWQRLESMANYKTAKDFAGYRERISNKEDSPGGIEEYSGFFSENGFNFAILHLNFDRAVMVGIKI